MKTHKMVEIGGKLYRVTFSEVKPESVTSVLLLGISAIALTGFLSYAVTSGVLKNLLPGDGKMEGLVFRGFSTGRISPEMEASRAGKIREISTFPASNTEKGVEHGI